MNLLLDAVEKSCSRQLKVDYLINLILKIRKSYVFSKKADEGLI